MDEETQKSINITSVVSRLTVVFYLSLLDNNISTRQSYLYSTITTHRGFLFISTRQQHSGEPDLKFWSSSNPAMINMSENSTAGNRP